MSLTQESVRLLLFGRLLLFIFNHIHKSVYEFDTLIRNKADSGERKHTDHDYSYYMHPISPPLKNYLFKGDKIT